LLASHYNYFRNFETVLRALAIARKRASRPLELVLTTTLGIGRRDHGYDTTEAARVWFANVAKRIQERGLPPLGFHLLLGPDFQVMAQNQSRNLEEGRIVLAQVVARK